MKVGLSMPTINDIAKLANVSKATVSLALSGDPRISVETRQKIEKIAEGLGYIPNRMARGLSRSKSQMVGALFYGEFTASMEDLFSDTLMGITHEALRLGYNVVLLGFSHHAQDGQTDWTEQVIRSGVDGLIVISVYTTLHGFDKLFAMRFPIVLVGRRDVTGTALQQLNFVATDQFGAGRMAAEYLLRLGHRELAVVSTAAHSLWMEERILGFFSADRGMLTQLNERVLILSSGGDASDPAEIVDILNCGCTAFFAISPEAGLRLLHSLQQTGVQVPQEVSLLVYDDFSSAPLQRPPITVIKQDMKALGQMAFTRLLELCLAPDSGARQLLISALLVERSSCGPLKA